MNGEKNSEKEKKSFVFFFSHPLFLFLTPCDASCSQQEHQLRRPLLECCRRWQRSASAFESWTSTQEQHEQEQEQQRERQQQPSRRHDLGLEPVLLLLPPPLSSSLLLRESFSRPRLLRRRALQPRAASTTEPLTVRQHRKPPRRRDACEREQ